MKTVCHTCIHHCSLEPGQRGVGFCPSEVTDAICDALFARIMRFLWQMPKRHKMFIFRRRL